jgi:hypothetical protein
MPEVVVHGAIVLFIPNPDWMFQGWDGRQQLTVPMNPATVDGSKKVAVAEDIIRLHLKLVGKQYVTPAHAVPGTIASAQIVVNEATLSMNTTTQGKKVVIKTTTGTFTANAGPPAMTSSTPSSPDPVAVKSGTFIIEDPGQTRFTSI